MKKSWLALIVLALFAASAHAQSSVTLYGLIDTGITYTNNQGRPQQLANALQSHAKHSLRPHLKSTEDLGAGLKATFKLEQGFKLNNGTQAFAGDGFGSQAWVGLQHDSYGTLTFGRQYDAFNDLVGPLSAEFNTWGGSLAADPFENDNLAADSVVINNSVKYVTRNFHGLTAEGMYSSNRAGGFGDNRSYSFSASYAQGPFTVADGYLQFNNAGGVAATNPNGAVSLNDGSANFVAQRQRIWGANVSAVFGPVTIGLVWSHTQLDNMASVLSLGLGNYSSLDGTLRLDNYEANVKYALTAAWSVSAAYHLHRWRIRQQRIDCVSAMEHGDAANGLRSLQAHRPLSGRGLSARTRRGARQRRSGDDQHVVAFVERLADGGHRQRKSHVLMQRTPRPHYGRAATSSRCNSRSAGSS